MWGTRRSVAGTGAVLCGSAGNRAASTELRTGRGVDSDERADEVDAGVGDFLPATVDRQCVPSAGEFDEFSDVIIEPPRCWWPARLGSIRDCGAAIWVEAN